MRFPLLLVVALLALAPLAAAYPDPQGVPRSFASECLDKFDRSFVYDFVGTLDGEMGANVEGAACEVYAKTGAHFVLVTVPSTDGEVLESYALHLFERWGVGEGERNDGIMLLYVRDYDLDGKSSALRIEVGYGLEAVVNPLVAGDAIDVMREAKASALDAGYAESEAVSYALGSGTLVLLHALDDGYVDGHFPEPRSGIQSVPWWVWVVAILVLLSVVSAMSRAAKRPRSGWGYYPGSPHWSSGVGGYFAGQVIGGMMRGGGRGGGGFGGGRSGGGGGSGGF